MLMRFCSAGVAAVVLAAIGPAATLAAAPSLLSVESGHTTVIASPGLQRVAIGDGRIANVVPIGTSEVVVSGKAPGHTTLVLWTTHGQREYEITVTEAQLDDLAQVVRAAINEPSVSVISFNHSILITGTVADGGHLQTISDIVSRFNAYARQQKEVIVNAVTVRHPIGDLQGAIANLPGAASIRVDPDGKGNVIVSGHVRDAQTAQAILERVRGLAGPYLAENGKLVDRITTDLTSQIDVKVYVLEVGKNELSKLGVALQNATYNPDGTITYGPPSYPITERPQPNGRALNVGPFFLPITLAPTINLLMTQGHTRVLSSPDLVTLPGTQASFLVGGEIPIPFNGGNNGQIVIQYKEYGVKLNVTPTLLGNGSIESKITPEVSNLDFSNAIEANGFVIPALSESKLSTDIITQPGEAIVMGGLVQHIAEKDVQKIPLLGDLPILGKLFRSTQYQRHDSDVVFVLAPEVITR